jgi:hypothetical protein
MLSHATALPRKQLLLLTNQGGAWLLAESQNKHHFAILPQQAAHKCNQCHAFKGATMGHQDITWMLLTCRSTAWRTLLLVQWKRTPDMLAYSTSCSGIVKDNPTPARSRCTWASTLHGQTH